jgi:tRNA 2-thiouridine synthesizing protein E
VSYEVDKEGFLLDLNVWNESVATTLAEAEGIELTAEHWQVVGVLRTFYAKTDVAPAMRAFVKLMQSELPEHGNSIALMHLFLDSPAKTAAKIAGLPRPTNCL